MEILDLVYRFVGPLLTGGVVLACICRITLMKSRLNLLRWFGVYALFAFDALGVLLDQLGDRVVDLYDVAGIAGMLLYLVITWKDWAHGPPRETFKKGKTP